jgi:DNA-directed RNA polymerase subunit H (RpoH/RPB5)
LPEISRFDPQALVVGLRPGDICKIDRSSVTALNTNYYRICI